MTRIDVEQRPGSAVPWWAWLLLALLVLAMAVAAWYFLAGRDQVAMTPDNRGGETQRTGPGQTGAGPAEEERRTDDLDTVLRESGMPRQFAYGGMTWEAQDVGRLRQQEDNDLIAIGPRIQGYELYYRQGQPTNPYETLYLRGNPPDYTNTYVRYEPVEGE